MAVNYELLVREMAGSLISFSDESLRCMNGEYDVNSLLKYVHLIVSGGIREDFLKRMEEAFRCVRHLPNQTAIYWIRQKNAEYMDLLKLAPAED